MNTPEIILKKYTETAGELLKLLKAEPDIAFVAGSGIGDALEECGEITRRIPYAEIPRFKSSGAAGHKNEILLLKTGFKNVLVFSGRFHLYEGFSLADVVAPVAVAHLLNIRKIILTNAAGGLDPLFTTGDIMLIDDVINFTFKNFHTNNSFKSAGRLFANAWREKTAVKLTEKGINFQTGTYLSVTGPNYETPAEIRAFRKLGAHSVGMSTVHEAQFAALLGMKAAGCSLITNTLREVHAPVVTHEEVLEAANAGKKRIAAFLQSVVEASDF